MNKQLPDWPVLTGLQHGRGGLGDPYMQAWLHLLMPKARSCMLQRVHAVIMRLASAIRWNIMMHT